MRTRSISRGHCWLACRSVRTTAGSPRPATESPAAAGRAGHDVCPRAARPLRRPLHHVGRPDLHGGGLNDAPGFDHLDNDAVNVKPVAGTVEIDVDELKNTGTFEARLKIPEGDLVLAMDRFHEFNPCQNGGIVGFPARARHRFGLRRQQLAEGVRLSGGMGIRTRHAERQAALRQLRNALHGDAGYSRPEDAESELPDGRQEAAGRRGESRRRSRSISTSEARRPTRRTRRTAMCSCTSSAWK